MKLVSSPASPFVRKVRVLLRETGLDASVEELDVATTPYATAPEVIAANPVGKIPALIRADGPSLYDSRVITRYLDSLAGAGLYPDAAIWEVLTLEATGDAIMDCAVSITYEGRLRQPWRSRGSLCGCLRDLLRGTRGSLHFSAKVANTVRAAIQAAISDGLCNGGFRLRPEGKASCAVSAQLFILANMLCARSGAKDRGR
jgi:hypothetical protein